MYPPPSTSIVSRLKALSLGLVRESPEVTDVIERRRARFVAGYLLCALTATVVYVGATLAAPDGDGSGVWLRGVIPGLAFLGGVGLYGLARSRHHRIAGRLVVVMQTLAAHFSFVVASQMSDDLQLGLSAAFLAYPVLVAGLFLPSREVLVTLLGGVALGAALWPWQLVASAGEVWRVVELALFFGLIGVVLGVVRAWDLRAVRSQSALLDEVTRTTSDAIAVHRDGQLVYANPAFEALEPALRERLVSASRGEEPHLEAIRSGAETRWFEVHAHPLEHGTLHVASEVTERESTRAALMIRDRLSTLGLMTAGLVHELRNSLTYALGNAAILADSLTEGSHRQLADDTLEGIERLASLIDDANRFGRSNDRLNQTMPPSVEVKRTLRIARSDLRRVAELHVQLEETPPVTASPARLGQILLNLLQNAAQAVEAREERGEIFVRCRAQDGEVQIEVEDTGQGMSPEVMERVFQPFFTTKGESRGTGLGLYLSRQLAEEMGGTLEVRSTLGSGSTFTLRLPAASTDATSADASAAPARPASRA